MTTKSDPIVISDDEDNGQDDEILSVGSSDGSIELIEERPPPPPPPFRTAQEKAAARSTTRLKLLSTFTEYRGSPSGSRHSKTPRQPNINGQLPTPERSPPRPLPRSSQQFLGETSPIHSSISERTSSTRPNKRSYVLEEGRGASAESNSRKRPRNSASQLTLPSRPVDIIVIDDDDDVQEVQPLYNETSDESDWDLYHAGFVWPTLPSSVINAPKPSEPDPNEIDHTLFRLKRLRLATDEAPVGCEVMHSSLVSKSNSWSQTRRIKLSTRRVVASNWDGANARLQLITAPGLLAASGSVCKIDQSGPAVAFASTAIGGGSGAWDADQRSANRAGALLYWQQSDASNILIPQQRTGNEWSVWEDPECHFRDNQAVRYRLDDNREQDAIVRVYYSVTDVKFNPLRPDVFVSSSFDKSIRTWSYDENQKRVRNTLDGYSHDYSATPQLLDFRPDSQILAVGCSDGSSYIHAPGIEYPQKLPLSSKQRLEVTAQSWGPESTIASDYLICGGGAPSQDKATANRGWASAWILRPDKAERVCNFIMGDTAGFYCNHLCVNPTGQYVAIASADEELRFSAKNLVEFFDLRAKPRAIFRQYLPPSSGENSEVLCSAFSPDGLYYACSREDNTAQVWDWRWMARNTKPLRMIEHQPPGRSSPRHTWGVPAMTWAAHDGASSAPLLVTGGDDGKIIQWDMRRSDSCLLAELESGVGSFSIGDRQKGEMPLIAGDCDGKLYIYDSSRGAPGHSASRLM